MTPAAVLRGPRRVGKTVLLRQLIAQLVAQDVNPQRILYIAFDELPTLRNLDEPVLAIARWYEKEVLATTFNAAAHEGRPAFLFFDEVQNLEAWAPQSRAWSTTTLCGRWSRGAPPFASRLVAIAWPAASPRLISAPCSYGRSPNCIGQSVAPFWSDNGLDAVTHPEFWRSAVERAREERQIRTQAYAAFSERGAYPVAQERPDRPWPEVADYLNETVIERAIQHDLRMGAAASGAMRSSWRKSSLLLPATLARHPARRFSFPRSSRC